MELTFMTLVALPVGLGLLGFVEPCTIGGHLLFLDSQKSRARGEKLKAVLVFIAVRAMVAGGVGAAIAYLGQRLIGAQTGIWLIFGLIYLAIGLAFLTGRAGGLKQRIDLAPGVWRQAANPVILGLAFGLNIPACAAPILFGLLGLAATTGTALSGFLMMALFGLFLSLPLLLFALNANLASWLDRFGQRLRRNQWILGAVFVVLGLWSMWFGLYVDPADWAGA